MPGSAVNEALRILLISTDETTRKEVSDALVGRAQDWRLFWASQPEQAPTRSEGLQPQIILLDEALEGVDLELLIQRLVFGSPEAAIIALVSGETPGASERLPVGVQTVLTKPISAEALISAIGQALIRSGQRPADQAAPRGTLVAFCAVGPGVGCTTVAVNTALNLARLTGELVALIDADFAEPGVDRMLAVASERSLADLSRRANRLERELDSLFVRHSSGARVLVAPASSRKRKPLNRSQVQTVTAALRRVFAWSVIDLGLPRDEMGFAFLDAADLVVLTVVPEMTALRDIRLFLDQIYARGYPLSKVWVVANRGGVPTAMAVEDLQRWLGVRVNHAIPFSADLADGSFAAPGEQAELAASYEEFARMLLEDRGVYPPSDVGGGVAVMPARAVTAGQVVAVSAAAAPLHAASPRSMKRTRRFPVYGGLIVFLSILAAGAILLMSLRNNASLLAGSTVAPVITAAADGNGTAVGEATPPGEEDVVSTSPAEATPAAAVVASAETPIEATATRPPATPTPAPTETALPTSTATPEPTLTPEPSATPSPTIAPTETAAPTAAPPTAAPRPTVTPRPPPTPQPTAIPAPAAPVLSGPVFDQSVNGIVNFSWQPAGPLPPGVAYEVVWWNTGEDPAAARGIAPPTTENSLAANLDVLYNSGQFTSSRINWSVIAVTTDPYRRLTQPGGAGSSVLIYAPQSGGGGAPPPPRP